MDKITYTAIVLPLLLGSLVLPAHATQTEKIRISFRYLNPAPLPQTPPVIKLKVSELTTDRGPQTVEVGLNREISFDYEVGDVLEFNVESKDPRFKVDPEGNCYQQSVQYKVNIAGQLVFTLHDDLSRPNVLQNCNLETH